MSAETIVNVAKFAWEVIKDGKPTVDISNSTANAVPQVDDWQSLTDTRGPNSYRIHYTNSFLWPFDDYVHVEFEILLKWDFGARYQGGGAFIPNIWVEVPSCFVGWPWNANISITAQHPTNAGSAGAPMARIPVTVKGTVGSGAELDHVEWGFVLFGDGSSQT
jgi:hypothetical protein